MEKAKQRPGVGIAILVTNSLYPNCVILGKRKSNVGKGLYQLPGGHIEFGESLEDAARRELLEETGILIKDIKLWHVVNTAVLEKNYHYVTIFMKGEIDCDGPSEPENLEPDKCEGWQWVKWDEFPPGEELFWCLKDFYESGVNPFTKSLQT